jgi:hypothetical protein
LTRHEFDQLRTIYNDLVLATAALGDMVIAAAKELIIEDSVNTALEQSNPGANNDDRPV